MNPVTSLQVGCAVVAVAVAVPVGIEPPPDRTRTYTFIARQHDGVGTWVAVRRRASPPGAAGQQVRARVGQPRAVYQYTYVPQCQGNSAGGRDTECGMASTICRINGTGPGPLSTVWRRNTTTNAPWQRVGQTCLTPTTRTTPTNGTAPGYDDIRRAWSHTPFAKATTTTQPAGNRTLVNLPTYLTLTWSPTGYRPGQPRTITLVGQTVRIRPTLRHFDYTFGDGHTTRTRSPGGPYPHGDIHHIYPHHGTYHLQATVTYGGEYSINNSPWQPIRDTIRVSGPITTLHVHSATNQLIPTH